MASIFNITTATTSIRSDGQGRAETTFTVENVAGRALKARASISTTAPAEESWFSLEGAATRQFAVNEVYQFTVRIQLPAGTPAGSYSFHLIVASEDNPDDDFTHGQSVSLLVPVTDVAKRPFPWWIAVVVVGCLLLGGVLVYRVVAWLNQEGPSTPPDLVGTWTSSLMVAGRLKSGSFTVEVKQNGPDLAWQVPGHDVGGEGTVQDRTVDMTWPDYSRMTPEMLVDDEGVGLSRLPHTRLKGQIRHVGTGGRATLVVCDLDGASPPEVPIEHLVLYRDPVPPEPDVQPALEGLWDSSFGVRFAATEEGGNHATFTPLAPIEFSTELLKPLAATVQGRSLTFTFGEFGGMPARVSHVGPQGQAQLVVSERFFYMKLFVFFRDTAKDGGQ